jgi:hypothetical protein
VSEIPAEARNENGEIPDWDRDQTQAELKPDLDALERAMSVAQGTTTDLTAEKKEQEAPAVLPSITLDNQIQAKIEEAAEELKQAQTEKSDQSDDNSSKLPSVPAKDQQELQKIAEELAKAKTIEDVDDKLAETLFGEEFSMMAAQVTANAADLAPANDSHELAAAVATGIPGTELDGAAAISIAPSSPEPGNIDTATSQRLATVRDINQTSSLPGAPATPNPAETTEMGEDGVKSAPAGANDPVGSFEDQMNMSMTQRMQALNVRHTAVPDDDEDDDPKKGFFSRLRRK